jgi:hypothetical protein
VPSAPDNQLYIRREYDHDLQLFDALRSQGFGVRKFIILLSAKSALKSADPSGFAFSRNGAAAAADSRIGETPVAIGPSSDTIDRIICSAAGIRVRKVCLEDSQNIITGKRRNLCFGS